MESCFSSHSIEIMKNCVSQNVMDGQQDLVNSILILTHIYAHTYMLKLQARKWHIKDSLLSYFSEYSLDIFEWSFNQGNHPLGFVNITCSNFVRAKS